MELDHHRYIISHIVGRLHGKCAHLYHGKLTIDFPRHYWIEVSECYFWIWWFRMFKITIFFFNFYFNLDLQKLKIRNIQERKKHNFQSAWILRITNETYLETNSKFKKSSRLIDLWEIKLFSTLQQSDLSIRNKFNSCL